MKTANRRPLNGPLKRRYANIPRNGDNFHEEDLTREHIIPFAQNGIDTWMNVVTACRACNQQACGLAKVPPTNGLPGKPGGSV